MEELDFNLRVGMNGGDDRFVIFALHDNMVTETNHFATP